MNITNKRKSKLCSYRNENGAGSALEPLGSHKNTEWTRAQHSYRRRRAFVVLPCFFVKTWIFPNQKKKNCTKDYIYLF